MLYKQKSNTHFILQKDKPSQNYLFGSVVSMEISYDEEILLVGYENGPLSLFDLDKAIHLENFTELHKSAILTICFFHHNTKSLEESSILTSDNCGQMYKSSFIKGIFSYKFEKTPFMSIDDTIFEIKYYLTRIFNNY